MKAIATAVIGCVGACLFGRAADAQPIIIGEDVADRRHAEYDALPIPFGTFDLYPTMTASAEFNDNVLATANNRQSDLYFDLRPEVRFRSKFRRHSLNGNVFFDQALYTRLTNQNTSVYGVNANGVLDISAETQVQISAVAERRAESLSQLGSFRLANKPARYDHFGGAITASHAVGDVTLKGSGSVQRYSYHDVTVAGTTFSQLYRNVTFFNGTGSATYRLTPSVGLIGTVSYDYRQYDLRPGNPSFVPTTPTTAGTLDRTSNGLTLQGGVSLQLSSLVFGTIQAGYFKSRYRDPRLRDPSGFNIDADILWNVTPLTSIRAHASRSVQDSSSTIFAGNTRLDVSVGVNHELYRYVLLQADAGYGHYYPNGFGFSGTEYTVGGGVRCLLNRALTINASVRQRQRNTADVFSRYRQFTARIGVGYTL